MTMKDYRPEEIEKKSMEIIAEELRGRNIVLPGENAPVVKRVIHTTADFDFAENLYFSKDAVRAGIDALKKQVMIVTDTNMALSGINRNGLNALGADAVCYMADAEVAEEAKRMQTTRARIAVKKACGIHANCIYAAGNAPTALYTIAEEMEQGYAPALVIAVPVGFVNVVEAKEEIKTVCAKHDVPLIAAMGRKGGSTVAAAILNALIYEAADMNDPGKRM